MASRKDEKEQRRLERLAREEAARSQERRRRTYSIVAGAVLVGAAVVAIVIAIAAGGGDGDGNGSADTKELTVSAVAPPPEKEADLVKAAAAADCVLRNPVIEGRGHTTNPVKYKTNPPSSGSHNPVPTPDGAYAVSPTKEHLVHALEHGRIIIQWDPKIPPRRIQQIKGLFDQDPYHLILVPNADMPYQFAVTAWGHIAGCKKITDESFDVARAFAQRYVDKAPEFVP
jgi:Protein of unknown function (DUF3105)